MTKAAHTDKELIINLLVNSFNDNKSVNYILKQDSKRQQRLRQLMEYSYEICNLYGDVLLSHNKKACALLMFPDKKRTTIKSIMLDAKFAINCLGFSNIKNAMNREAAIKKIHPKGLIYYLWFIGVETSEQGKGLGSQLMEKIIAEAKKMNRTICLETSTLKNIPWYKKLGFKIYNELDFGYKLYCMKLE
ncbi:MAG: GNAT family N-acetyltransferase [Chitinophagaceae bacterium]